MRPVVLPEGELTAEVVLHQRRGLHGLEHGGVDLLLIGLALIAHHGGLGLVVREELLLPLVARGRDAGEVRVVDLRNVHARHVELRRRADDVGLVDPTQGDAVDLVRSRHEEESRLEGLEADDALAAESAREEDANGSGGEGRANLRGVVLVLARVLGTGDVVGGVVPGRLAGGGGGLGGLLGAGGS